MADVKPEVKEWAGKIIVPKQKIDEQTPSGKDYSVVKFSFSREGSEKAEKGQVFVSKWNAGDDKRIKDAMESETLFEVTLDETPKYQGYLTIKLPKVSKFGGGGGGGGGGRPPKEYPPYYRGKQLTEEQFLAVYNRIKTGHLERNKKEFKDLSQGELSELVRSETSQCIIMIKENVWVPNV